MSEFTQLTLAVGIASIAGLAVIVGLGRERKQRRVIEARDSLAPNEWFERYYPGHEREREHMEIALDVCSQVLGVDKRKLVPDDAICTAKSLDKHLILDDTQATIIDVLRESLRTKLEFTWNPKSRMETVDDVLKDVARQGGLM